MSRLAVRERAPAPATPVAHAEREADAAAERAVRGEPVGFRIGATRGGYAAPADGDVPSGGRPLDPALRSSMERSFGHDFGRVRVHDAAAAAARRDAAAYTVGEHIVVGVRDAAPETPRGRWLFAHELAHVVQQTRPGAEPAVARIGVGEWFARLFGGGTFGTDELRAYLRYLDDHLTIEGDMTSDNKAREIVRRWRAGDPDFPEPSLRQKQLMLLEMIDGPTLDEDEHAILELLRGSSEREVRILLGTAGGPDALADEFHGSEADELAAFLAQWRTDRNNRPVAFDEIGRGRGRQTITQVEVNQDTPQTVTITYADSRMEAYRCSAGKGTCVVPPGGRGPSAGETSQQDTNWTPIGAFTVTRKSEDHSGISWWTQFHDGRAIALHTYSPVDGTPLSHGCVRLDEPVAHRIFAGAVPGRTRVRVTGTPTPRLTHGPLRAEWANDFSNAHGSPRDAGYDELRRHLRLSFGARNDAELDRAIARGEIPVCGRRP